MSSLVLIDTSAWIRALRVSTADVAIRERVQQLLRDGKAAWCDPVQLELWSGVGNQRERTQLETFGRDIPRLPLNDVIWQNACDLGKRARAHGFRVPANDLLIFSVSTAYAVKLEHADKHYEMLLNLTDG